MMAMASEEIAFKGVNDFFYAGQGRHDARGFKIGYLFTWRDIVFQNVLSRLVLLDYRLGCLIEFNRGASAVCLTSLLRAGFKCIGRPKNHCDSQHG